MGNALQRFIYNSSTIAPLCLVFALVWYLQKRTIKISVIAICIGFVLILAFVISFIYAKKHLAPIVIRTNDIAPHDGWVVAYVITYMVPFASLAIKDFDVVVCAAIAAVLLIAAPYANTAIPNPLLFFRGYHFYQVTGEQGVSGCVLISKRKFRKAKDLNKVNRIFDFLFLDTERR